LQRERVEPIPDLTVRGETGYNFETNNTVAGVELGIKVPLFDRNQGTILQAQGELARAQAEVARVELMLRQRFARAFTEYENAATTAKTYHDEILPKAEEANKLYRESFQQRRAAWPQVLDAQRQYYELLNDYLDELVDARKAEAEINSFFL